jgi:hypothetical protein
MEFYMKDAEDEAFDELAKRQGMWGGGFQAKRAMAADKLHWSDCAVHNGPAYPAGECDCGAAQKTEREALKLALEALNSGEIMQYGPVRWMEYDNFLVKEAITAVKAALAQPAQESVGYVYSEAGVKHGAIERDLPNGTPLYAAPPKRERVLFPTMLRKMWSGGEVQAWLDENVNKEKNA